MKEQLVIIGIDSMDRLLIEKYLDYLPNFRKIIARSLKVDSASVFPPDSDTAWASIFTGLNPAKHGLVTFVDPLEKASIQETDYLDSSGIRGRTFWDIAGRHGKRVCLIYPHAVYPVWEVNGFMIVPLPKVDGFQMYPPDFNFSFEMEELEVPRTIPNTPSEYGEYLEKFRKIVTSEFAFGRRMMASCEWDLFFFYSSALDFIEHVFWNYCDPSDPTYKGDDNPFRNAIRDFYILHDQLIGEMIAAAGENTPVIILSDHGHAMRPVNLFNVNEVLKSEQLLFSRSGALSPVYRINESLKRTAVNIVQRTGLRRSALALLRRYPKIREAYTVPSSIDFGRTIARCTDLSGMKSYTYGGVVVDRSRLGSEEEYRAVKERIMAALSRYTIPGTSELIVQWIREREQLYAGPFLEKYPDIVFQLRDDYGAGWAIDLPVFSKAAAHNFFPGSHRGDTPVLYLTNTGGRKCNASSVGLVDIAPTVLDLMGIDWKACGFDGKSIFE